ncbi:MAG: hypothetical protein GEU80_10955 [Dehalococcoidia bacterium]|nr:hypothetical protein [Dehalococcoidia bacterium]
MTGIGTRFEAQGEVSERAELLNGTLQLVLDGDAQAGNDAWLCACSLSWRLGRSGEVSLSEGDLTLEADGREIAAVLLEGVAVADPDTGAAAVRATFTVDAVSGELGTPGDQLTCELDVGVDTWRGEILVVAGD